MVIGVIGGSGLYQIEGFTDVREESVDTPFGEPSDAFMVGRIAEREVAFLPRHGRGHSLTPSEIPFRANLWAMKALGVTRILSLSAVGSLREAIVPGHFVMVDQFIDRTRGRKSTFFEDGIVAHVVFGDPVCGDLRTTLLESAGACGITSHDGGTYVCMEGPAFSTRAESELYRSWGADVIGMTNLQEAKLAREAEICYATVAMSTDYDCWHEGHDDVTVDQVIETLNANADQAKALVVDAVGRMSLEPACSCGTSLQSAILTPRDSLPTAACERLAPILGRVLGT